jgi:hypothetical protein
MKGFLSTAYWEPIEPLAETISEPPNPAFVIPRAPTIPEENASFVPIKHNFGETFDRPLFTGREQTVKQKGGQIQKDCNGSPIMEERVQEKGQVKEESIQKRNLTT